MIPMIKRFEFSTEGVTITIPFQGRPVRVFQLPFATAYQTQSEINVIRDVINVKLVAEEGNQAPIIEFNPPIELRVRYTKYDYDDSGGNLSLAYWDGTNWIRFNQEEHEYFLLPDYPDKAWLGGIGIAYIKFWDDPHIAWIG